MAEVWRILAPAKINIGLVVSPGTGGYHNIESVFQTVDLCDGLEIAELRGDAGVVVRCDGADIPARNTLTAAYDAFLAETAAFGTGAARDAGIFGARVTLTKRIPQGAGLGGGSADAAAFVRALQAMRGIRLDGAARAGIASRVGSDVFFFMEAFYGAGEGRFFGGVDVPPFKIGAYAAVVTGRGEGVRRIEARNDLSFVLVYPDVSVSTREAFALLDAENGAGGERPPHDPEAMYRADVGSWRFVNSFTKPVSRVFPNIARALDDVRETGAAFADMSGSGSTVFGVYESRENADRAVRRLKSKWERCWGIIQPLCNGGTHADYGDANS
jgi:4-diphosphocytidyl-2-C-methyl-D-erythritol kinase